MVQAYQKRAPSVIDYLLSLAERTKRRLMIRLVKGAYWDSEIKRAQVDGLEGYPVFTHKAYTDARHLACAKRLLARRDLVFPQFATHNAQTLSSVYHLAGADFRPGDYEFQCLHGMGETLYSHVAGAGNLNRPCRIYAPVGTHETLLAYLVRRLLENGANTSFVHQLAGETTPIEDLIADPALEAMKHGGAPHPAIALPADLFGGERRNSKGLDLSDARALGRLERAIEESRALRYEAVPVLASCAEPPDARRPVLNPANQADIVGYTIDAAPSHIEAAMVAAAGASASWARTAPAERAAILDRGAGLSSSAPWSIFCALLVREAGRTMPERSLRGSRGVRLLPLLRGASPCAYRRACPAGPAVASARGTSRLPFSWARSRAALAAGNAALAKPGIVDPAHRGRCRASSPRGGHSGRRLAASPGAAGRGWVRHLPGIRGRRPYSSPVNRGGAPHSENACRKRQYPVHC